MAKPRTVVFHEELWAGITRQAKHRMLPPEIYVIAVMSEVVSRAPEGRSEAEGPTLPEDLPLDIERSPGVTGFRGVYPNGKRFRSVLDGVTIGTYDSSVEAAMARYQEQQAQKDVAKARVDAIINEIPPPPPPQSFVRPYLGPARRR